MIETKNVVIHGDSRDYISKIRTPINAVVTDPPYGMDFQSNRAVTPEGKKLNQKIEGDDHPGKAIAIFNSIMEQIAPKLADEADLYIFTAWHVLPWWTLGVFDIDVNKILSPDSLLKSGDLDFPMKVDPSILWKQMLIWDKGYPGQGDLEGNWGCGHEIILYLKKGRRKMPYRRSGIIHVDKIPAGQNWHPTQKPVPLLEKLIEMSTNPGDLVVDPYSGSGSTSIAAKKLGRNSLAFELNEGYVLKAREALDQVGFVFG